MSDSEEELVGKQLKIVFVGEPCVGKSSVIRRLCYNDFSRHYTQTIGADFYIKHVVIPGRRDVTLRITDVGGLELNGNMLDKYLFNANIIIMVYDITNSATFDYLTVWIDTMAGVTKCPPIVGVIGNKCDAEHQRAISSHTVNKFVKDCNLLGFTMSAKTGEMVTAGIIDLVSKYLGVPLTKSEKEYQRAVIKAELIPATRGSAKTTSTPAQTNSSVCTLQLIEKYTENVRFCIICNYLSKIIPALQSRCTRFRFGPLTPEQILPRLNYVVDEEKLKVSEDGKKALLTLANGDMRKVLNVLQSTWLAYKDVTEDNVYTCVGHPLKTDVENIVKWLLNEDFKTTYNHIKELQTIKGLALNDILNEVHLYVHRIEFPFETLITLLDKMAEIQYRLSSGTNENIQLTALIAAFQHVKDINVPSN